MVPYSTISYGTAKVAGTSAVQSITGGALEQTVGFADSYRETIWSLSISGPRTAINSVLNPVESVQGVIDNYQFLFGDPKGFTASLWNSLAGPIRSDWNHGKQGRAIGSISANVVFLAIGGKAGSTRLAPKPDVIKGTNLPGEVTSRSSFRKQVTQGAWDDAADGPNGGKLCPTCGDEVIVTPFTGIARDWDRSHFPSWTNREFPTTITRGQVIDNYNTGVILECQTCNRSAGNDDSRFSLQW